MAIAVNSYGQILNSAHLDPFFEKLAQLEKDTSARKINIVHIGDSHVQGKVLGNAMRKTLQQTFGNGGYGFTFPYGFFRGDSAAIGDAIRFFSNALWQICRNNLPHRCPPKTEFGLGGYGYTTSTDVFALKMEIVDKQYRFNTVKIVSAGSPFPFRPAASASNSSMKNIQSSWERHVVKRGETLHSIARKYGVSASVIKDRNNMRSNSVRSGKVLLIPVEVKAVDIDMSQFLPLEFKKQEAHVSTYWQKEPASEIYLIPAAKQPFYNLSGIILENDSKGILYHGIGTVGSMASHFNATPLFFEQLPVLSPDLIIISFGTNESHNRIPEEKFTEQINLMVSNVRKFNPNVPVVVTTPPTSLFRGKKINTYAEKYAYNLMQPTNFAVWDLYMFTGGPRGALEDPRTIQIAPDNMHYTREGYINQGTALANDILHGYEMYKQSRKRGN
jgi:LysM repeat protein